MKVLLVEDSRSVRAYVEAILRAADDVTLLPSAVDGREAIARAVAERPDVILMDLEIPELDGISCIHAIMERAPCPIVVLSSYVGDRTHPRTFEAFEAGAVDVMRKPEGLSADAIARFREPLLRTVRSMAAARVVRRPAPRAIAAEPRRTRPAVVGIGASTGGPPVVHRLLRDAGPALPCPIVIAQHIVPGFEAGLVEWLATTGVPVALAAPGTTLLDGTAYVLPSARSLRIDGRLVLASEEPCVGAMPSIDRALGDLALGFGRETLGILLSGMGRDGERGAVEIRSAGGEIWTQLGASCVVDGIPAAVRSTGTSTRDLTPEDLGSALSTLFLLQEGETASEPKIS